MKMKEPQSIMRPAEQPGQSGIIEMSAKERREVSNRIFKKHIISLLQRTDSVEALIFVHAFLKIHNQKDRNRKKLNNLLRYALKRYI
ncbi:MAG: hypothetical protein K2N44_12955 [Lachnospiraceae bacterium]|nr:hypothetical protein [Lachnospiraceae bacterium]